MNYYDEVFKGCTRPALVMGVPLIPFVGVCAPLIVIGMWMLLIIPVAAFCIFLLILPIYFWMRIVTKTDDQRLLQYILHLGMVIKQRNRRYWQAISYSPYRVKIRK